MERQDQLKICQQCQHRHMDFKKGLVCGLTNELANFKVSCDLFIQDEDIIKDELAQLNQSFLKTKRPKVYHWQKLGLFSLFLVIMFTVNFFCVKYDFNHHLKTNFDVYSPSNYTLFFQDALFPILLWLFIGWEVGKIKNGLIAGVTFALSHFIVTHFLSQPNIYYYAIPFLLAGIGFTSFDNKNLRLKWLFPTVALITYIGHVSFVFIDVYEINDTINYFLSFVDIERESHHFLSLQVDYDTIGYDNVSSTLSLNQILFDCFKYVSLFMILTYAFKSIKYIRAEGSKIILSNVKINFRSFPFAIFFLYTLLVIFSISIVYTIYHINQELVKGQFIRSGQRIFANLETSLIILALTIITWAIIIHIYRKIMLEYYLRTNTNVGWMYYFSCVPIVNIILWPIAWLTLKLDNHNETKSQLNWLNDSNRGFTIFYFFLLCLYYGLELSLGNSSGILKIELVISFGAIVFYIFHKSGIYFLISIKLLAVCLLIYLSVSDHNRLQVYESALFWSFLQIALLYLYYPVFHLKEFKIAVRETED